MVVEDGMRKCGIDQVAEARFEVEGFVIDDELPEVDAADDGGGGRNWNGVDGFGVKTHGKSFARGELLEVISALFRSLKSAS